MKHFDSWYQKRRKTNTCGNIKQNKSITLFTLAMVIFSLSKVYGYISTMTMDTQDSDEFTCTSKHIFWTVLLRKLTIFIIEYNVRYVSLTNIVMFIYISIRKQLYFKILSISNGIKNSIFIKIYNCGCGWWSRLPIQNL